MVVDVENKIELCNEFGKWGAGDKAAVPVYMTQRKNTRRREIV